MTILVHLNVEKNPADERTADEIADAILTALGVAENLVARPGREDGIVGLTIICPMAEEVEV